MRLNIVEIREDDKGDLWFLVAGYYTPSDSEMLGTEDWWLHLSDEYAEVRREDGPVDGKRYKLMPVDVEEIAQA